MSEANKGFNIAVGTPVNAISGSQTALFGDVGTDGDFIIVDGVKYTFKTTLSTAPTVANEIFIGASAGATATNLKKAINKEAGAGTNYSTPTVAHPTVVATLNTATVTVTYKIAGVVGNAIAVSKTSTAITLGGALLTGGVDGTISPASAGVWYIDTTNIYACTDVNGIHDANWVKVAWTKV